MKPPLEDEVNEELRRQDRARKLRQRILTKHPDCRDPDHPGCPACLDDNEGDDDDRAQ